MSGIIFFGIIGVWGFIAVKLAGFLTSRVKSPRKKIWLYPPVLILIFVAPIMDEIIGGFQFRALCKPEDMLVYDADKIRNKILLYSPLSINKVKNTIITIEVSLSGGVDLTTGDILLERKKYRATGGWLSRLVAFNSMTRPYTFNGVCGVKNELSQLEKKLDIKAIYR